MTNTINYYSLERIGTANDYYTNTYLLILSFFGVLAGIFRKNKYIIIISLWV